MLHVDYSFLNCFSEKQITASMWPRDSERHTEVAKLHFLFKITLWSIYRLSMFFNVSSTHFHLILCERRKILVLAENM